MKKKAVKLAIEEPCHEDWNAMSPKEKGRFCGVCSKVVVDFTTMSDREVLNLLDTTKNGDTCGQFTQTQLQKTYRYPVQETNSFSLRALLLGATLTSVLGLDSCRPSKRHMVGKVSMAQTSYIQDDTLRKSEDNIRGNMIAVYDHKGEKSFSGRVLNNDRWTILEGAKIQLFSSKDIELTSTVTSDKGAFKLSLDWDKDPAYVMVSRPGFEPTQFKINEQPSLSELEFGLTRSETMIKGKVKMD